MTEPHATWRMALFAGLLFALPVPASAEVRVQSSAPCVSDPEALADALRQTLEREGGGEPVRLSVRVVASPMEAGVRLLLVVEANDAEVLLERAYALAEEECPDAADLLSAVLARFLQELPRDRWVEASRELPEAEPPPPASPPPEPPAPEPAEAPPAVRFGLGGAVHMELLPEGGDSELTLFVSTPIAEGWRLLIEGGARVAFPYEVGSGRAFQLTTFGGLGVAWSLDVVRLVLGVRAGALFVHGLDFPVNQSEWLAWVELRAAALFALGDGVLLGPEVAGTPMNHRLALHGSDATRDVALLRVGLAVRVEL